MQETIQQFNEFLVKENIDLTIVEYVVGLNDKFYDIDITFINEFMELINKDDFIIHHTMLDKYNVLNTIEKNSGHIKRLLDQYDFEEEKDYIKKISDSGYSLDYFLKPEIFKMLLMRSKNTRKYANYYIMLEKAICYYEKYQNMKLSNFIRQKIYYKNKMNIKYYEGGEDEDPDFEDSDDWIITVNRWFTLIDITIDEFLEKIKIINNERFE